VNTAEAVFAAFVVVRTEGGFAATTRAADRGESGIGLPGGKLDPGESPVAAVIREAAEEGWLVSTVDPVPIQALLVDGKLVLWFTATTAVRLSVYKERGRITPVVATFGQILSSGYGNEQLESKIADLSCVRDGWDI
jgi:8-oxo-dGTP pyrophosphatase MutT (NUDIX family)